MWKGSYNERDLNEQNKQVAWENYLINNLKFLKIAFNKR